MVCEFNKVTDFLKLVNLKKLKKHKNLSRINFINYSKNRETLFTRSDMNLLCKAISKVLPVLENVYEVNFEKNRTEDFPMKEQLTAILKGRQANTLKYLIKNGGEAKYNKCKLIFLGDGGVGKTSTLRSLTGRPYKKIPKSTTVASCEEVFFDLNLENWTDTQTSSLKNSSNTVFHKDLDHFADEVVRSKVDKVNTKKYKFQIKTRDRRNNKKNIKPKINHSKKKSINPEENNRRIKENPVGTKKLSVWDFGGQQIFDVTHHLYLTEESLCIIVFSLKNLCASRKEKERELNRLKEWLGSISNYTAAGSIRIFFVGTRCEDKTVSVKQGQLKTISQELHNIFADFSFLTCIRHSEDLIFFPVENSLGKKNKKYLLPLKKSIMKAFEKSEENSICNSKIPLAWIYFMKVVLEEEKNIISVERLIARGKTVNFNTQEVLNLIQFFTKAGAILNFMKLFENINKSGLISEVVLRPTFILKALGRFIFDKTLHDNTIEKVSKDLSSGEGLAKFAKIYEKYGLLNNYLLDKIFDYKSVGVVPQEAHFIKVLCERMLIFSKLDCLPSTIKLDERFNAISQVYFLVPSMVTKETNENSIKYSKATPMGYIKWKDVIPQGLFERVICSFLHNSKKLNDDTLLSMTKNSAYFRINNTQVGLKLEERNEFKVLLESKSASIIEEVYSILKKVNEDLLTLNFCQMKSANIHMDNRPLALGEKVHHEKYTWKYDCFMSHSWGDKGKTDTHDRVIKFADRLIQDNFLVWIDDKNLTTSIYKDVLLGIDRSAAFIAFFTVDYLEKTNDEDNNAGKEFRYISEKSTKYIIPVVLDKKLLKKDNWQGTIAKLNLGSKKYIDFTSEEKIKENWNELCNRIVQIKQENKRPDHLYSISKRKRTLKSNPNLNY